MYIFLKTPFFITSLSLCKSTGAGFNLSACNSDNSWIPNLSTSDYKLAKSSLLANCNVSTSVGFFKSDFVA